MTVTFGGPEPSRFPFACRVLTVLYILCEVILQFMPLSVHNVFAGGYFGSFLIAPFTFGNTLSLIVFAIVCGPRLRKLELQSGTLGAFVYHWWAGLGLSVLHILFCAFFGLLIPHWKEADFNGAWPLIGMLYARDARSDFYEKIVVVKGYPITAGMLPVIVFLLCWLTAWCVPLDMVVAMTIGAVAGDLLDIPDVVYDALEDLPEKSPKFHFLMEWPSYIHRRNAGFRKLLPGGGGNTGGVYEPEHGLPSDGFWNFGTPDSADVLGYNQQPQQDNNNMQNVVTQRSTARNNNYDQNDQNFQNVNLQAPRGTQPATRSYQTNNTLLQSSMGGSSPSNGGAQPSQGAYMGGRPETPVKNNQSNMGGGGGSYANIAQQSQYTSPYGNFAHGGKVYEEIGHPAAMAHMPDMNAGRKDPFDFDFQL